MKVTLVCRVLLEFMRFEIVHFHIFQTSHILLCSIEIVEFFCLHYAVKYFQRVSC